MSFKTIITAALFAAAATTAFAQTTQQPPSTNPLRPATPATPATPAAPAQPAAPAAPRAAQPATPAPATAAQPAQRPAAQGTLVNLNTATKDQLDSLPQIGDARAAAIIAKRPYKDWNDFVAKGVIPSNAEAAIKDKVRFR
jgi:DNA uptake protein ComE-like DNA-binding protein